MEYVGNVSDEADAALVGDPKDIEVVKKSELQLTLESLSTGK